MNARGIRAIENALRRAPEFPEDRYEHDAKLVANALVKFWGDEALTVLARALVIAAEAQGPDVVLLPLRRSDARALAHGDASLHASTQAAEALAMPVEARPFVEPSPVDGATESEVTQ